MPSQRVTSQGHDNFIQKTKKQTKKQKKTNKKNNRFNSWRSAYFLQKYNYKNIQLNTLQIISLKTNSIIAQLSYIPQYHSCKQIQITYSISIIHTKINHTSDQPPTNHFLVVPLIDDSLCNVETPPLRPSGFCTPLSP